MLEQDEPAIDRLAVDPEVRSQSGQVQHPARRGGRVVDQTAHFIVLAELGDLRHVAFGERAGVGEQPVPPPCPNGAGESFGVAAGYGMLDEVRRRARYGKSGEIGGEGPIEEDRCTGAGEFGIGIRFRLIRNATPSNSEFSLPEHRRVGCLSTSTEWRHCATRETAAARWAGPSSDRQERGPRRWSSGRAAPAAMRPPACAIMPGGMRPSGQLESWPGNLTNFRREGAESW